MDEIGIHYCHPEMGRVIRKFNYKPYYLAKIQSMRKTTFSDPVLCLVTRSNNLYLYVSPRTWGVSARGVSAQGRGCLPTGGSTHGVSA